MILESYEKQIADKGRLSDMGLRDLLKPYIIKNMSPEASEKEVAAAIDESITRIHSYWEFRAFNYKENRKNSSEDIND
ncbi:MAG: hypothetical protein KGY61_10250 [Desulfobacterales bacterium]|nr:hypothetical protein [Desulfobacterales bacterium]